jgi:membrane-bound lytic murein transglycosylase MltF
VKILVVDSHKAKFWKRIFTSLTLHPELAVRTGGDIAWAIRKGSPKLKAALNEFVTTHHANTTFGRLTLQRYLESTKYVKSATAEAEMRKFQAVVEIFRKYGGQYEMDWLLMAAQGYQESRLDQGARSAKGSSPLPLTMPGRLAFASSDRRPPSADSTPTSGSTTWSEWPPRRWGVRR